MLKDAFLLKEPLQKIFQNWITADDSLYYNYNSPTNFILRIEENQWNSIQKISLKDDEIIGFFGADVYRYKNIISNLAVINFSKKPSYTFSNDLRLFVDTLFQQGFDKINFSCAAENPLILICNRLVEKRTIRKIGYFTNEAKLRNGKTCHLSVYEILKINWFETANLLPKKRKDL